MFEGIIADLFPEIILPKPDYEVLLKTLNDNIEKRNLQPVPWFINKIIQVIFLVIMQIFLIYNLCIPSSALDLGYFEIY